MSRPRGRLSGGGAAGEALARLGFDLVTTISGAQVLPLYDSLARHPGIRLVVPRSERAAAAIAEGYAAACGLPAAVVSTVGVGVINELPAIGSAARARRPLLSLSPGQPPAKLGRLRDVFQGLDHAAVFGSLARYRRADFLEQIPLAVAGAARAALDPPGPVHLDISFPELFRRSLRSGPLRESLAAIRPLPAPKDGSPAPDGAPEPLWVADRSELLERAGVADGLTPGIERMALGTGFALGAALGARGRRVVLLATADDLFAAAAELDTAARHGIAFDLAVVADGPEAEAASGLLRGYGIEPGSPDPERHPVEAWIAEPGVSPGLHRGQTAR